MTDAVCSGLDDSSAGGKKRMNLESAEKTDLGGPGSRWGMQEREGFRMTPRCLAWAAHQVTDHLLRQKRPRMIPVRDR